MARPQNGRCDAGAYESAPPLLANVTAAATGPNTATVSASVNAYLQDTTVVARYGTTTTYGVMSQAIDAGSANGTVPVVVQLIGLAPATTYHVVLDAANADGAVTSMDVAFVTAPGSRGGEGGSVAPVIANIRQSARRWLPGPTLATLTRARGRTLPIGTTFTFGLDQVASVTLTFTRVTPGRRVNGRCVAPRARNQHRPTCGRQLLAGTLTFAGHPGANQIRFYGRLSRRARLAPGNYRMVTVAVNRAGQRSARQRLSFTILRP